MLGLIICYIFVKQNRGIAETLNSRQKIYSMEANNVRIGFCKHTQNEVVQEKFGEEWVCIHDETREQELENIEEVKKLLKTN